MSHGAPPRPRTRWLAAVASIPGLLLLALAWLTFIGSAMNLSADPGNAGSVVFLWSIVLVEAAVLLGSVLLLVPARTRRVSGQLLPWAIWLLVLIDLLLLAVSGFY
jgi:hypothetical protein